MTDDQVAAFLAEAHVARLASHNPDGSIHLAPAWFLYDGGCILIGTQSISRKARNVVADAQVTVLVDKEDPPFKGVIIYGDAILDREDVIARRAHIFARYMPMEQAQQMANSLAQQFEPVIIRVRPEHIISYDYAN